MEALRGGSGDSGGGLGNAGASKRHENSGGQSSDSRGAEGRTRGKDRHGGALSTKCLQTVFFKGLRTLSDVEYHITK